MHLEYHMNMRYSYKPYDINKNVHGVLQFYRKLLRISKTKNLSKNESYLFTKQIYLIYKLYNN